MTSLLPMVLQRSKWFRCPCAAFVFAIFAALAPLMAQETEVAQMPFRDGFEAGFRLPCWSGGGNGRNIITTDHTPFSGAYHLVLDDYSSGGSYSRNEFTLRINLAGYSNVVLRFFAKSFLDNAHGPPPLPFVGGADFDGVAVSADGTNWYEVRGLRGLPNAVYTEQIVNLDSALATYGLNYNADFRIRFNQYDDYPVPTDGIALDEVTLAGDGPSQPATFRWSAPPVEQQAGQSFPMTVTAYDSAGRIARGFNGAVDLGAWSASGPVLQTDLASDAPGAMADGGLQTVGYIIETTTNITVTHLLHFAGTKISLWTDTGTLLVQRDIQASPGYWSETRLDAPVELLAGQRYRLAFLTAGPYAIGSGIQKGEYDHTIVLTCQSPGDNFPTNLASYGSPIPYLGIRHARSPLSAVAVTPAIVGNFTNGVWSGPVAIQSSGAMVYLEARDNEGHSGLSEPFKVVPWEPISVSLPALAREGDGVLFGQGRLQLAYVPTNDVLVNLESLDLTEITVPLSVLIPAGQTTAVFDVTVVDDVELDASQPASVRVTAEHYATNSATMTIHDNESTTISVLLSASVVEGANKIPGTGQITLAEPATDVITVTLRSSNTNKLTIPHSVNFAAGQTSALFNLNLPDNPLLDGPSTVAVTAQVPYWPQGVGITEVLDDESTNLTLFISWQGPFREGHGTLSQVATIRLGGIITSNLSLSLWSSDATELTVPATVEIPAFSTLASGVSGVSFPLTIVDDLETDGTQAVQLDVSAPGFGGVFTNLLVADNDVHHFIIQPIATLQTSTVPFRVSVSARELNDGVVFSFNSNVVLSATGSVGAALLDLPSTTTFVRGTWTGFLTITNGPNLDVRLRVGDGNGHDGWSNPFDVTAPDFQLTSISDVRRRGTDIELDFTTLPTRHYQVECAGDFTTAIWTIVAEDIAGTGGTVTSVHSNSAAQPSSFYRIRLRP